MVDRLFKNWKTSLIGAVVLIGSLVLVYLDKATLTEAGGFITLGLTFFFLKD